MSSDAIYNVTQGSTRPWKNTVFGLGLASLTPRVQDSPAGFEQIRTLHISYSETKGIESEFAYSFADDQHLEAVQQHFTRFCLQPEQHMIILYL